MHTIYLYMSLHLFLPVPHNKNDLKPVHFLLSPSLSLLSLCHGALNEGERAGTEKIKSEFLSSPNAFISVSNAESYQCHHWLSSCRAGSGTRDGGLSGCGEGLRCAWLHVALLRSGCWDRQHHPPFRTVALFGRLRLSQICNCVNFCF